VYGLVLVLGNAICCLVGNAICCLVGNAICCMVGYDITSDTETYPDCLSVAPATWWITPIENGLVG